MKPGQRLAHYELTEKIGEGGMGVVWRAEDTVLHRAVALKLLPAEFAAEPDRLSRFEKEARFLASVNHSNVAAIHGLEEAEGLRFLVLELVPGSSLLERVRRGALPLDEALRLCRDIALGLEAAHEKGVLHRDLKPGNVQVTPKGEVKLLDFGLAKAFDEASPADEHTMMATVSVGTAQHTVLGTTPYMSPEQATGSDLDKRTDIWAFGCILFELLTGQRAFAGKTVSSTIAAIHAQDPDWTQLPAETPIRVRRLLERCLAKDLDRRLRDIGDARLELDDILAGGAEDGVESPFRPRRSLRAAWLFGAIGLVVGALVATALLVGRGAAGPAARQLRAELSIGVEGGLQLDDTTAFDISRDGTRVVFTVERDDGSTELWMRELDSGDTRPIEGTHNARGPFFSPDGQWVGYFHNVSAELRKAPVAGGASVVISPALEYSRGASWGPDGRIVFAPGYSSVLHVVSADGGEVTPLTTMGSREKSHRFPHVLPDGNTVLFTSSSLDMESFDGARIAATKLDDGRVQLLVEGGTNPHYSPTGHIVYARGDALYAVAFDAKTTRVSGAPFKLLDDVSTMPHTGTAHFAVSTDGTLVYASGVSMPAYRVEHVDRQGRSTPVAVAPRFYNRVSVSPDGRQLALGIEAANTDAWVYDLDRHTLERVTTNDGEHELPMWTPDGDLLIFWTRPGEAGLYRFSPDGTHEPELVAKETGVASSVTQDGLVALMVDDPESGKNIAVVPLGEPDRVRMLVATAAQEYQPRISPDERWLAYVSDESGRPEVYVTPFPDARGRRLISNAGGQSPLWSLDGDELFYLQGATMMSVSIPSAGTLSPGVPQVLFELGALPWLTQVTQFDVAPDGNGFYVLQEVEQAAQTTLHLVLNWFEELERRNP